MTLDQLPIGQDARIVAVDWNALVSEEARRLRALGLEEGAKVALAHRGVFGGRDPIAIAIGRMTVAVRRAHAAAMTVIPIDKSAARATASEVETPRADSGDAQNGEPSSQNTQPSGRNAA
ncbi:ferrous iron transport protein A [Novosphingobium sp. PhB165]|nr:ferrous iron transport protein A [Novosphingobium sp. PhB165]